MSSTYETVLADVLDRMQESPAIIATPARVRRAHRTVLPREDGEALYVIDGPDKPGRKRCEREAAFTVALMVRDDAPAARIDELKLEVVRRVCPSYRLYPDGVAMYGPGEISVDSEIADSDATRVDIAFSFCYAAPEWTLGE